MRRLSMGETSSMWSVKTGFTNSAFSPVRGWTRNDWVVGDEGVLREVLRVGGLAWPW